MKGLLLTCLAFLIIGVKSFAGNITQKSDPNREQQLVDSDQYEAHESGIYFSPNEGQIADLEGKLCPDILYNGNEAGAEIYLRKTGISYVYNNLSEVMHLVNERVEELIKNGIINEADEQKRKDELLQKQNLKVHRVDMDFDGCNSNIFTINEEELGGYQNFYYAHCPNGVKNVMQYSKVTYKNIYNNIEIKYYGSHERGLKYDLIVQPFADPNQIKLHWKGAESIYINRQGNDSTGLTTSLVIKTGINEFYETLPKVYQVINGKVIDVLAKYVINPISKGEAIISFSFSDFNPSYSLIIDPWATYYGVKDITDYVSGICSDKIGNVLITGTTNTNLFPVSAGFQMIYAGGGFIAGDAYVVKFNGATGVRIWATFYGGASLDGGNAIASDKANNIMLTGFTFSNNFPVQAVGTAYSQVYGGGYDAFVVKFDPNGLRLWATYYGGSGEDRGLDITSDNADNILITGTTQSAGFPVLAGFQMAYLGNGGFFGKGGDAFVVKFNSLGARQWATFYGGTSADMGTAITTDNGGNIAITGKTLSANFPVFTPALSYTQPFGGSAGSGDAFIVKFNSGGTRLWAAFYGGNDYDGGLDIVADIADNLIIAGTTSSVNFPIGAIASNVVWQSAFGGGGQPSDVFLVKFNAGGTRQWATFYGANTDEVVGGVITDGNGNIYLLLEDEDLGHPLTASSCAYNSVFNGGTSNPDGGYAEDQLIVKFAPNGQKTCATFMGGRGEDELDGVNHAIAIYGNSLFITGTTTGWYPVTAGAFQTIHSGGVSVNSYDIFVASICTNICEAKNSGLSFTASTTTVCANAPIKFIPSVTNSCDTSGYRFHWTFTGGTPSSSDSIKPTVFFSGVGNHDVKLVLTTTCKKDSITKVSCIAVNSCGCALLANAITISNSTCNGSVNGSASVSISNGAGGPYTYSWSNGISGTTSNTTISITGLTAAIYTVTITEGACTSASTTSISSPPSLIGQFTKGAAACNGCGCKQWILVNATGGTNPYTYIWPDGYDRRYKNQLCPGSYTVNIKDKNGCSVNVDLTTP